MNQEELSLKIDLFLWELLPKDELAIFEKEMYDNPEFRDKVADRYIEHRLIRQMQRDALSKKMAVWREEMLSEDKEQEKKTEALPTEDAPIEAPIKPTVVRNVLEPYVEEESPALFVPKIPSIYGRILGWAVAASLAILVFGYWGFVNKTYNPKIAGIVAYGAEEAIRLPDDNPKVGGEGAKDKVEVDFDNAHYGDAIARYEDFLAKNAQNTEGGAVKKRIEFAEWKLTLVYYVSNDKTKNTRFLALLNQIAQNPNHAYHTKAVELKQKVNSFWGRLFN